MTIVYSTAVKNNRMTQVNTALGAAGVLVIGTSALSGATGVLATVPLANPAGAVAGGVLTLGGMPRSATATAAGTAAKAELRDSGGTVVASGLTVGLSGADIIIGTVTISVGLTVQLNSGAITHG
jgi:hypothetical protein